MALDKARRATGKRHGGPWVTGQYYLVRFVLSHEGWNALLDVCEQCGEVEEDLDLLQLTNIRFSKNLCRPHFRDALQRTRAMVQRTP